MRRRRRSLGLWLAIGWIGFALLPWNAIAGQGFLALGWLSAYPLGVRVAPAAVQIVHDGRLWLLPLLLTLGLPLAAAAGRITDRGAAVLLVIAGCMGLVTILGTALAIDIGGWTWRPLA